MEDVKSSKTFSCLDCDYYTSRKSQWERHILTEKHIKATTVDNTATLVDKKVPNQSLKCCCGNEYKCRQGLWKHKRICKFIKGTEKQVNANEDNQQKDKTEIIALTELVKDLVKHNQDLTNKIIDIYKVEQTQNQNNTITNSNIDSNNKTFNLQFFLNETCKNAMNISEFVDSINFQIKDLEHIGEVGFVDGISDIVLDNLNELDSRERPLHCSDNKREILYIKDNNEWIKDDSQNTKMTSLIKQIAHKNMKVIPEWIKNHPDCHKADSKQNDKYLKIILNSMSGSTDLEQKTNINKIISKVAKKVTINKTNNR